jgi:CHAD domain-containing protein
MEREAKLTAPAGLAVPDLHGLLGGMEVGPATVRHLDALYYDTADLRLARAGATLRCRTGEPGPAWALKLPGTTSGATLARSEIVVDGPSSLVPATLLDLVRVYARGEPVVAVARLQTARTVLGIGDESGKPLVELVDDTVTAVMETDAARSSGCPAHAQFREIELELEVDSARARRLLRKAVDRLVAAGFQPDPPLPKVVRALGSAARLPPDVAPPPPVDAGATASQLVGAALARSVAQLVRCDPGLRLGEDVEAVHQFRVAVRRLRSDLRTFGAVLDQRWAAALRADLRWLAGAVGAVRDDDVLIERLQNQIAALPKSDRPAAAPLLQLLDRRRETHRHVLLTTVRSARYDALLDTLVEMTQSPASAVRSGEGAVPAAGLHLVRRPWRQLAARAGRLGGHPSDHALHEVRILAKRCRYAAEAMAPLCGRPARRFAAAMADVQTLLGDHQDAVIAETWLRSAALSLGTDPTTTATLSEAARTAATLCAGELILVQRTERAAIRSAWPATWDAASSSKLRSWM